jgi:STE24 endopeptidase
MVGLSAIDGGVYPTLIAPLFNRFSPLEDLALKQRIEALLARTGFTSQGVFVMDGSRRSSHGNAYFTGFGSAKRIVFFDTLLKQLARKKLKPSWPTNWATSSASISSNASALPLRLSLGFLFILGQLLDASWFYAALGVSTPSTAMA